MGDQDSQPGAGEVDLRLWGKSRGLPEGQQYPLVCHLLDAGAVAGCLWESYVPPGLRDFIAKGFGVTVDHAGALIALWAALHDIGKLTPEFQRQEPQADLTGYPGGAGRRPEHDAAGHKWLQCALSQLGYAADDIAAPGFAVPQLVGGHHGIFHRGLPGAPRRSPLARPGAADDAWERQRLVTFEMVRKILGSPAPPPTSTPQAAALACAIIVLADWLASQEPYLIERLSDLPARGAEADLRAHFAKAVSLAAGLVTDAGLTQMQVRAGSFAETFTHIPNPNELQRSVSGHLPGLVNGPGLLLVMAPPGIGKTETALYGAKLMGRATGRPGVYMALPTTATADQIHIRIGKYLQDQAVEAAPLMLLHSMAWLNARYSPDPEAIPVLTGEGTEDGFAAADWLRGRWRGMCASWAVGTIDQALMAVLPSRHNALRLFSLAGKTVIIDEVHACDPYMQGLLLTLLRWLGSLGTPVVVLSATLTSRAAEALTTAYLDGARVTPAPALETEAAFGAYPGWLYADATTGDITGFTVDPGAPVDLAVSVREVAGRKATSGAGVVPDRGPALREELAPLVKSGGCALVICTTVSEAQETYCQLRDWFAELSASGSVPPDLDLLHARFPARQREQITNKVMRRYGKNDNGDRPRAAVLVATAIVEQSLDLDFDLIISDLAPIALLIQRAGRCWRHERLETIIRPPWAEDPRLTVLVPAGGPESPRLFRSWTTVYDESLLIATYGLLSGRKAISIPADVQALIDDVYEDPRLLTGAENALTKRIGDEIAQGELANMIAIPGPRHIDSLCPLTDRDIDPDLLATRLDADSARALPVFVDGSGTSWLDRECTVPLPSDRNPLGEDCRKVYGYTVPVRGGPWLRKLDAAAGVPDKWRSNVHLRDLVLLYQHVNRDGTFQPTVIGGREFMLDDVLGLRVTQSI